MAPQPWCLSRPSSGRYGHQVDGVLSVRVFTYSEARQNLAALLTLAQNEEVMIWRKDGKTFSLRANRGQRKSPFDVPDVQTRATTTDLLDAVRALRATDCKTVE
jgi:hypothetical protein